MYNEILVIGKKDTIMGFKSIGLDVLFWSEQTNEEIKHVIKKGYKIVFITEDIYEKIDDLVEDLEKKENIVFTTIPSMEENKKLAFQKIEKLLVQALGKGTTNE